MSATIDTVNTIDIRTIRARGCLADAKAVFADRGWKVLPNTERLRIARWGIHHAWLACRGDKKASARRWCYKWAPWIAPGEVRRMVDLFDPGTRWTPDQSAVTPEITVSDRNRLRLRFIGASDDTDYIIRHGIRKAKAADRARRFRAARSTGKRGRPALGLSPEEALARHRAQGAERSMRIRASRKNPSRDIRNIDSVTDFSVTHQSLTNNPRPWELLGMSRATYYRHKAKESKCREAALRHTASASDALSPGKATLSPQLDTIDFAKFGITAIRVMHGERAVLAWAARGAQQHL